MEMMDVSLMASLVMIMSVYHFIGFVTRILTVKVSVCCLHNRLSLI